MTEFFKSSSDGSKALIAQRCSNRSGRYLVVELYKGGGRRVRLDEKGGEILPQNWEPSHGVGSRGVFLVNPMVARTLLVWVAFHLSLQVRR